MNGRRQATFTSSRRKRSLKDARRSVPVAY